MKQFITPIITGIVGVVIPIAGMAITPTRDLILGLAPEEAILELADKIDEQRVSTEQSDAKILELQSQIFNQQQIVNDQSKMIEEQKIKNEENNKVAKCAELSSKNTMCNRLEFRKPLEDYIEEKYKQAIRPYEKEADEKEWRDDKRAEKVTEYWNICQDIYKQCD